MILQELGEILAAPPQPPTPSRVPSGKVWTWLDREQMLRMGSGKQASKEGSSSSCQGSLLQKAKRYLHTGAESQLSPELSQAS